jgi:PEP-CTERM motif-containing protein
MRTLTLASLTLGVALMPTLASASGTVLYEQLPAPASPTNQVASQTFPDLDNSTILAADDFVVPAGPGWRIEGLTSFFTNDGNSGANPMGVQWTIWNENGPMNTPGDDILSIFDENSFDLNTGNANIDLAGGGNAIDLDPGTYWVTSTLVAPISLFGQEFQLGSDDGAGSANFQWFNGDGEFGLPNQGWNDAFGEGISEVQNLAFQIHGSIVPEPATLALLAIGAVAMIRSRRS